MEYYEATEPLFIGRARAHNPGDKVPAVNVKRHGWEKKTKKPGATNSSGRSASSPSQAAGSETSGG